MQKISLYLIPENIRYLLGVLRSCLQGFFSKQFGRTENIVSDLSGFSEERRTFILTSAKFATASLIYSKAPYVFAKEQTKLRVIGTHVTLQEELREKAEKDLGIEIEFMPGGSAEVLHKAATIPQSFDLYEQWSNSIKILWRANSIQPIDVNRLRNWQEINNISKTGRIAPDAALGAGDRPSTLLYIQEDNTLGENPTEKISFLPYVHNVDSFGYNSHLVSIGEPYHTESWSWLFDEEYHGKVAIVNAPTIGLFDMALAAEASGLMRFKDIGNPTIPELDKLFSHVVKLKREGHFRGLWSSVPQSVDFMSQDGVLVESMFSPAVSSLNGRGVPCIYAAPKEGYRAWHGVMCLSAMSKGKNEDAAYEYMNWWLSGWPGAFIARQGYYISNPERSKSYLSQAEWDYWYEGKPASEDLKGTDGNISVKKGFARRGGSYKDRFSNVAVWNTVIDEYDYLLSRWSEFVTS